MILPVRHTKNFAPSLGIISRTVIVKSFGFPNNFGWSDNEYWVFAIHIGSESHPNFSMSAICLRAWSVNSTSNPPYTF